MVNTAFGYGDQASFEDTELLQQKFLEIEPQLDQMPYETKVLWLKIITRLPELALKTTAAGDSNT